MRQNKPSVPKKILVGLSGGVDSAVCALLLKHQGYEVIGVHFLMTENDSLDKVKKIAKHLKIPLLIENVSKEFKNLIIGNFIEKYSQGETPNPCVICNRELKYQKLIELADKREIEKVATGHYARVIFDNGKYFLLKGKDPAKDQSYFLYRLSRKQLARIILPLGEMMKSEVKEIAEKARIPIESGESQDVCFFAKQDSLAVFLEKYLQGHPGKIVDENGIQLGLHEGVEFFTIGQRKGLDIGGDGPYYVFDKNNDTALVKVTSNHDNPRLYSSKIDIGRANWIMPFEARKSYEIKTRYQAKGSKGTIECSENIKDECQVLLDEPQWAVSKGQSLVVFDGEKVLGGGIIN